MLSSHAWPAYSLGRPDFDLYSHTGAHNPGLPLLKLSTSAINVNTGLLLIYRLRRDGRPSWPGWLTHSGQFTCHRLGVGQEKSALPLSCTAKIGAAFGTQSRNVSLLLFADSNENFRVDNPRLLREWHGSKFLNLTRPNPRSKWPSGT